MNFFDFFVFNGKPSIFFAVEIGALLTVFILFVTHKDEENKKSNEEIAQEVLQNKWGTGTDRKNRLTAAGYDYRTIQKIVNEIIAGRY